jgi:uncharacterized protein DUF6152
VKTKGAAFWILLASLFAAGTPVSAHHGNGEYDEKNPITLKGTVTDFQWTNPHGQILFEAKDASGNVTHWACGTLSLGKLVRSGWTRHTLKPGDQITITLDPARNGLPAGYLRKIVLSDGTVLSIRGAPL